MNKITQEYELKIEGIHDFIIVTASLLQQLIVLIHNSENRLVNIELSALVEEQYLNYIIKVINSNRNKKGFKFMEIKEKTWNRNIFFEVLKNQLKALKHNSKECFEIPELTQQISIKTMIDINCSQEFFSACKDEKSIFIYYDNLGNRDRLMV